MACQLLEVLASSDTGRDCLVESKLIPEIGDLLKLEVSAAANSELKGKELVPCQFNNLFGSVC